MNPPLTRSGSPLPFEDARDRHDARAREDSPACSSTRPTPRPGRSAPRSRARIQPAHPADSSLAHAAAALAAREFEVAAHTDGPLTADASPPSRCSSSPTPPTRVGGDRGRRLAPPRRRRDRRDRRLRRAGGGLIVLAETEQDKYGNNVAELVGRFGIEIENATVQDYEHHHGDAPSWVLARSATRSPPRRARRPRPGSDRRPARRRRTRACFYRAGALTRRQRGPGDRPSPPHRLAPERAARRRRQPRRRPRRRARRLRPVRRRLHRRARPRGALAQPRLLGRPALVRGARSRAPPRRPPPTPPGSRLRAAVEELRLTQSADGSVDTVGTTRAALERLVATIADSSAGPGAALPAPGRLHRGARRRPARLGRRRLSRSPTSSARSRPFAPSASAATGSSTCACFRCTSRTPHATPASRR